MKKGVCALLMFVSCSVNAGYLVKGGTVTEVVNTSNNGTTFSIKVTGGTNNLCEGGWIGFPVANAADPDTHKRAYSTVLTALTAGLKVDIYNYSDNGCGEASYVGVKK